MITASSGDIFVLAARDTFSCIIKLFTASPYSHVSEDCLLSPGSLTDYGGCVADMYDREASSYRGELNPSEHGLNCSIRFWKHTSSSKEPRATFTCLKQTLSCIRVKMSTSNETAGPVGFNSLL